MAKLDQVRQAAAPGGRPGAFPPGMDPNQATGRPARLEGVRGDRSAALISLERIERDPDQPREEFDEEGLARLARSLRERGQLQPIRVRWDEGRGVYVILAGERRWRAARMAGLAELQCVVHDGDLSSDDRLVLALVENALRDDLKPVEQAACLSSPHGRPRLDYDRIGRRAGPPPDHRLESPGSARTACPHSGAGRAGGHRPQRGSRDRQARSSEDQVAVAQAVEGQGLGRDDVAAIVRAVKARKPAPAPRPDPVELDLGDGCIVTIRWKKAGSLNPSQALRRALKLLQERERSDDQAA